MILRTIKQIKNQRVRNRLTRYYFNIRNRLHPVSPELRRVNSHTNPGGIYCTMEEYVNNETYYTYQEYLIEFGETP